ncbi:TIR domain-containing protein [Chitinophaga dinghuensis]|uniref:TIR domain-containing protein n=1 Tax=Chitinophaga dinghuensis TaxID=1539050 RepID=A0A327VWS1_9BACT|nr:TIR domain-containing protein [Chitinophaga dinghuensis]RAJ80389.1 TIR domain-containing protein [Chitinophaga dinghuensis]
MPSDLILQMQQASGDFSCEQFSGVPSPQATYIAIAYADSPGSANMANDLKKALIGALFQFDAHIQQSLPPCNRSCEPFNQCAALRQQNTQKILFVVTDGASNVFNVPGLYGWNYTVIPVMKDNHFISLSKPFSGPQVAFWKVSINEVLPVLWQRINMTHRRSRIFISYKKTDSQELADQLFEELTKERFDVFLDRYSIDPGVEFQNRLFQELSDKAMVIMLESKHYLDSDWVRQEIAFAKKYRLGIMALNIDNAPIVFSIDDEYRERLDTSTDMDAGGRLRTTVMKRMIARIKQEHEKAIFRKRNVLQSSIYSCLKRKKLPFKLDANGFIETSDSKNQKVYKIWAVPRPPEADDFHYTDSNNARGAVKMIVGPKFIEERRGMLNDWMAVKTAIQYFREAEMIKMVEYIHKSKP